MDTNNPVLFIIDCMRAIAAKLSDYDLIGVPIWTWFIGFIFVGMVVSTFWRGDQIRTAEERSESDTR